MAQEPPEPASGGGFAGRLQLLVDKLGSRAALAKAAGIPPSTMQKYAAGSEPTRPALVALARAAQVSVEWLATGQGSMAPGAAPPVPRTPPALKRAAKLPEDYVLVPICEAQPTGRERGGVSTRDLFELIAFRRDWIEQTLGVEPRNLVALVMRRRHMSPTIEHGDLVLIDREQDVVRSRGIYVLVLEQRLHVIRIENDREGNWYQIADNPNLRSPALRIDAPEKLQVLGRVIWAGGLL